jgi:hypothetical protein
MRRKSPAPRASLGPVWVAAASPEADAWRRHAEAHGQAIAEHLSAGRGLGFWRRTRWPPGVAPPRPPDG